MDAPNSLEQEIKSRIAASGPMTFRDFMDAALYTPGMGYYSRDIGVIGRKGDFYTSPHLHPVFGAMLGRQAEECWTLMGRLSRFSMVEPGGGRGFLALDMLDALKGKPLYDAIDYHLIERNPSAAQRQREMLSSHEGKITWHDQMSELTGMRGLIISNELMDALPVHLVVMLDGPKEIYVALRGDTLVEEAGPLGRPEIERYLSDYAPELEEGMRAEVNLDAEAWLAEAASILDAGFIVTIDYGFPAPELYSEDRPQGTLLCYHRHTTNEDYLSRIGEQDITAHVNFSSLKRTGDALGLMTLGFTRQGPYLVSLGIDEVISELGGMAPGMASRELLKVHGLIMPGTMGDTHKVLVQSKGIEGDPRLRGFLMKNQAGRL